LTAGLHGGTISSKEAVDLMFGEGGGRAVEPGDADRRARELLENVCGFALGARPSGLAMLPESADLEVIAGDGSGGCFYLGHAQRQRERVPVVYLSSYGEASRFAEDFTSALTIVAAFPGYWCDMLVAAHKGDEVLRRAFAHYEADLEPDSARAREELCNLLRLDPQTAAGLLTAAVRATPAFEPLLASGKRKTPAASFKDRLAPR
jgi:hypothetical protein